MTTHLGCWGLALLALAGTASAQLLGRLAFSEQGDFSENAIVRGVQATQAQCDAASHAVWADAQAAGAECL
ncbi:MAG: hypothetical protein RLZZ401_647, partial [Pseudomonadota bacterium]